MFALSFLILPFVAGAQVGGGGFDPYRGSEDTNLPTNSFYTVLMNILTYGLVILTILAVIGFIISGIIFITAGGAGKADVARKWLIYSIIGVIVGLVGYIVIALISQLIRGNVDTGPASSI